MIRRRAFLALPAVLVTAKAQATRALGIAKDSLPIHDFKDTIAMLEYCHSMGAGGMQSTLSSLDPAYLKKLRALADQYSMYLEVQTSLPEQDTAAFSKQVEAAKAIGARSIRTACLRGRRYETFSTMAEWQKFARDSRAAIERAIPIVERNRIPLAIENHKDRTADEMVALMKQYGGEYLGVCLDTGNNMALLDDPMDTVSKLAPYAITTHIKDMAVEAYPEGFLLSEVPLGQGMLDMKAIVQTIVAARPKASLVLEMITRDPLKIPCRTDKYWITFSDRRDKYLPQALARVQDSTSKVPRIADLTRDEKLKREEQNVRDSVDYFRTNLAQAG